MSQIFFTVLVELIKTTLVSQYVYSDISYGDYLIYASKYGKMKLSAY